MSATDEVFGYVVVTWGLDEAWHADWDGEVHATRDDGMAALFEARQARYVAALTELHHAEVDR